MEQLSCGQEKQVTTDNQGQATFSFDTTYNCNTYCYYPDYNTLSVRPVNSEEGEISAEFGIREYGPKIDARIDVEQTSNNKAQIKTTIHSLDLTNINNGTNLTYNSHINGPAANTKFNVNVTEIYYEKKETSKTKSS